MLSGYIFMYMYVILDVVYQILELIKSSFP